jgi:hypothetical protein
MLVDLSCPSELAPCHNVLVVERPSRVFERVPSDSVTLVAVDSKPAIVSFRLGAGRVWYFAEPRISNNMFVDRADHLRLLYQIAQAGRSITFDEFHHGYVAAPSGSARDQWLVAQILIGYLITAGIVIAASRTIRFGPPSIIPLPGQVSRQADFVAVLALLYEEHRALGALAPYLRGWRQRVERRFSISATQGDIARVHRLVEYRGGSLADEDQLLGSLQAISSESDGDLEASILIIESVFDSPEEYECQNLAVFVP